MQGLLFDSPPPGLKSNTEMFEPVVSAHVPSHPTLGSPIRGDKGGGHKRKPSKKAPFLPEFWNFLKTYG